MTRQKMLQGGLLVLILLVWGAVLMRVGETGKSGTGATTAKTEASASPSDEKRKRRVPARYDADHPNPFRPELRADAATSEASSPPAQRAQRLPDPPSPNEKKRKRPALRVAGVVDGTVLVSAGDAPARLLSAGDSLAGARLVSVGQEAVRFSFRGREFEVALR